MHIGVLTGGGDVPGLNACIRALALNADDRGWTLTGFKRGWAGLLSIHPDDPATIADATMALGRAQVRGLDRIGGTVLHTSRLDPRTTKQGDRTADVLKILEALGIDALVTLGGDGTLRFSAHLSRLGVPVISIPKTMDNDVCGTDYCIGFSTAVTRSVEAINALRTTAESHERIAIVELFGRRSGETALLAGFLAQVDRTVIAEIPADLDQLLPLLRADKASNPARYAMCVVSEGARLVGEDADSDISKSGSQRQTIGIGHRLAHAIEARSGEATIVQQLAYLMRAGAPDALDRMVGLAFGALAVELLEAKTHGRMLALVDGNYSHVAIDSVECGGRKVNITDLYDASTYRARLTQVLGKPMFLY